MSIDRIGRLFDPNPADPEGQPLTLAGWHVNVTPAVMAVRPGLARRLPQD